MDLRSLVDATAAWPPSVVYAAMFGGALVEYVFPPFPGDTLVVAGAALIGARGAPIAPIWLAVTAGSVAGAAIGHAVGRWIARGRLDRLPPRARVAVDDLVARFERHGAIWLAANRFLPGVRPLFFVAAGLADLPTGPVLAWATVSAVLWNSGLVGLGIAVGQNVERLGALVGRYQTAAGIAVVAGVAIAVLRALRRGRRER